MNNKSYGVKKRKKGAKSENAKCFKTYYNKKSKKVSTNNVLTQNIKFRDSAPRGDPKEPTQIKIKY